MPQQAAPQSGQAPAADAPPLLPIPPYRERLFTIGVGERLREGAAKGESEAQTLAHIAQERTAIAAAIDSEDFRDAFARAYEQAHNARMPQAPVSAAQARHATDDIIKNRANDARQLTQLITQPNFMARARTAPAKPVNYELPAEKITEMISRFTAEGSRYGIDARIHNQQSMEGHRIGHLALADIYAANGPLHAPFTQTLKAQLPNMDDAAINALASDWLEARREPAQATAEQLAEGGHVYTQVMQRSDATRIAANRAQADAAHARAPLTTVSSAALMGTTALTPRQIERSKDQMEKASEWAYTMNHAISCGATDVFIQPFVGKWVSDAMHNGTMPKGLRWLPNIFEKHDHGHGHVHGPGCGHDHHDPSLKNNLTHWISGEIAGDVGAVPLTVAVQRFFPGFMNGIRHLLEPVAGGIFRRGAARDAQSWANQQSTPQDAAQIADKAKELYEYEMAHLPQAVVWNAFSIPINLGIQRVGGSNLLWREMAVGKIFGAAVSNTLLIGGRAMAPDTFHRWDQWNSRTIVVPTTKFVGNIFGADTSKVDDIAKQHHHTGRAQGAWGERLEAAPQQPLQAAR